MVDQTIIRSSVFGIILDNKNHIGRFYPADLTMAAFREALKKSLPITLNQPEIHKYYSIDLLSVNVEQICGEVLHVEQEGHNLIVEWKILNTPMGILVDAMFCDKTTLGLFPHGLARIMSSGKISSYQPLSLYIRENKN